MAKARDIVINLQVKAKEAVSGLKDIGRQLDDAGDRVDKAGGRFKGFGDRLSTLGDNVDKSLSNRLGPAGDAAEKLGFGLEDMGGKAGLAAGAVLGLGGAILGGVGKVKQLYEETRTFNQVAGTTWEEGSRVLAVFKDLKVDADEAQDAVAEFTNTVGQSPEDLQEFGIEIVKAKDGTTDMIGTLKNVATAFSQTRDPARRAAMGTAFFGEEWHRISPFLDQGGEKLEELIRNVDESRIATEEGAEKQAEFDAATRDLNESVDALQRALAENLIPALSEVARLTADIVGTADEVGHIIGEVSRLGGVGREVAGWVGGLVDGVVRFGSVSDTVGDQAGEMIRIIGPVGTQALQMMHAGLKDVTDSAGRVGSQAEIAGEKFKEFEQRTRDLLQAQEDLREAGRDLINTELALEQAQIRAGDASQEVSTKADVAEKAISDYGSSSQEAAIAVEEQRRATVDAKGAIDGAAQAAVTHAQKLAESNGTMLTAAERTKAYREELIRMRAGTVDRELIAWMDAQIERLAGVAAQAQNAEANLRGYNEALYAASGGEPNFVSRDSSGRAVIRRATGGPVWPGQTYLVGEHGPELLNLPSGSGMNGPGYVLSTPEAQRVDPAMTGMAPPSIRRNLDDGTVQFPDSTKTYPIATAPLIGGMGVGGGAGTAGLVTRLGLSADETGPSLTTKSLGLGGGIVNYYITINGYAELSKLMEAIRRYEGARF